MFSISGWHLPTSCTSMSQFWKPMVSTPGPPVFAICYPKHKVNPCSPFGLSRGPNNRRPGKGRKAAVLPFSIRVSGITLTDGPIPQDQFFLGGPAQVQCPRQHSTRDHPDMDTPSKCCDGDSRRGTLQSTSLICCCVELNCNMRPIQQQKNTEFTKKYTVSHV